MDGDARAGSPEASQVFDEAKLLAEARAKTGLSDFGDGSFREPLRHLLEGLSRAGLNRVGETVLRTSIRRSLVQRLRTVDLFTRHPEIEDERIDAPIVIVGMMRSGTTLLQRLLARDPRHVCALGWEIAEPTPRPGAPASGPDPRIADGIARDEQMRAFSPKLHAIHPTDALEADEEIVFLADAFLSHVPEASCHLPDHRRWLDEQDFTPAYRWLERMLKLLQWQKRRRESWSAPAKTWVLKTPAHLGYLGTLRRVFPDARIVHLHRDPHETVASGASLNATLWQLYADDVDLSVVGAQWLERMAWATERALAFRDGHGESGIFDVGYARLLADPVAAVEDLYAALGRGLSSEARVTMNAWLAKESEKERPRHRYALEDYGLSRASVDSAFVDYRARFAPLLGAP